MTTKKQRQGARNFKTLWEWEKLGFELRASETCFAVHSFKGPVYAECQVKTIKKKKSSDNNNDNKQKRKDSDS